MAPALSKLVSTPRVISKISLLFIAPRLEWATTMGKTVLIRAVESVIAVFLCKMLRYTDNINLSLKKGFSSFWELLTRNDSQKSGVSLVVNMALQDLHCLRRHVVRFFCDDLELETAVLPSQYMHTMSIC